jgi:hypothetical protein
MECPVCLSAAKNATPSDYRGLVIACPRCGVYRVTANAAAKLPTLRVEGRLAALERAKTQILSSTVPTISSSYLQGATSHHRRERDDYPNQRMVRYAKPRTFSHRPELTVGRSRD